MRNIDPQSVRLVEADVTPLPAWRPQGGFGPAAGGGAMRGPIGGFHLLPRFTAEMMEFSPEQRKQLAAIEKETKTKLDKILTPKQKKILDESGPPAGAEMGPPPAR